MFTESISITIFLLLMDGDGASNYEGNLVIYFFKSPDNFPISLCSSSSLLTNIKAFS